MWQRWQTKHSMLKQAQSECPRCGVYSSGDRCPQCGGHKVSTGQPARGRESENCSSLQPLADYAHIHTDRQ
jgi:hypothetical protein